jgi:hypothetical protein
VAVADCVTMALVTVSVTGWSTFRMVTFGTGETWRGALNRQQIYTITELCPLGLLGPVEQAAATPVTIAMAATIVANRLCIVVVHLGNVDGRSGCLVPAAPAGAYGTRPADDAGRLVRSTTTIERV